MKSNSTTALTLYPFLRQIKMRRSTADAVTKGIDATGLPWLDQPSRTLARGIRLRVMGAFSRRCNGIMERLGIGRAAPISALLDRINNVNPTFLSGYRIPKM